MEARLKIRSSDKSAERGHCRDMRAKGTEYENQGQTGLQGPEGGGASRPKVKMSCSLHS